MGEKIFDLIKVIFFTTTLTFVWTKEPCPHIQLWDARAQSLCEDQSWFHCLETQAGEIKERCVKPRFISKGHYPVFLIGETEIIEKQCPPSLYQPNGLMSNKFKSVTCMYEKDKCNDDGEEACDDGSDVSDRMCRCDYKNGYRSFEYLLSNAENKSCYEPRSKERGCIMLPCKNGTLNKAYQCITACPHGHYRSEYDLKCVPIISSSSTSTTTTTSQNTKSHTINKQTKEPAIKDHEPENNMTTYGTIAITCSATIIFAIMFFLIYRSWRKKYYKYCRAENDNKSVREGGEHFRKNNSNSFPFRVIKGFDKVEDSIGCITVELPTGSKATGTGFRVGEKYVLTAYHIVQEAFENFWRDVYRRLKLVDNKLKPDDGSWSLTDFILSMDRDKQMNLKHVGEEMVKNTCSITFGYVGDERGHTFSFSYDAPFISTKHDIAILELNKDSEFPFPTKLVLSQVSMQFTRLHVLGHPDGGELTFDPLCSVICSQRELERTKKKAIQHFTSLGETKANVEKEYTECELSLDHILFHCSEGTTHGASGSPLFGTTKYRKPKVIGMLLKGYPKMFYNEYLNNEKAKKYPEVLIESGISMQMLNTLLKQHELFQLANDIFNQFDVKT